MQTNMWTYPWDILDVGLDAALDDLLGRAGVTGISLAASYHAGHFLQARSPRRKTYFPEDGTIYFQPDLPRYNGLLIQPKVADLITEQGDLLRMLEEAKGRRPFRLNAWTVCLHNTRLGMLHPEVTTMNAFGDRNFYNLCPSHPEARAYVTTMVADMTDRYALDEVELESPNFMGFAHEYHHEKDGVGLTRRDDFLFSLCFCDACQARAAKAGVDAEAARKTVRRWLEESCSRAIPQPDEEFRQAGLESLSANPEVVEYALWRREPVTSLIREIREAANPRTQVRLLSGPTGGGWLSGIDPAAAAAACDGLVICSYNKGGHEVEADLVAARRDTGGASCLGTGLRVFYPEVRDGDHFCEIVRGAAQGGARSINFYNYGLIPAARLDWIRQAVGRVLSA